MPTWRLVGTSLPDILPATGRSPGLHVSTVIHDICVKLGHYTPSDADNEFDLGNDMSRMQLGQALEWAIIDRLSKHDTNYIKGMELSCDGLYLTPDLLYVESWPPVVVEIKLSWMSSRLWPAELHEVDLSRLTDSVIECVVNRYYIDKSEVSEKKYFKYKLQMAAYCHALGSTEACLMLCHIRGAYREFVVDARTWQVDFTQQEIDDNWSLILRHADTMR